jgi:hypothetical protein
MGNMVIDYFSDAFSCSISWECQNLREKSVVWLLGDWTPSKMQCEP